MNSTKRSQWPYVMTVLIVWTLMLGTLAISASHIIETAQKLGLADWQAFTTPALIDVIAVVGKLGRLDRFAEQTRRSSFRLMVFGGLLSLACNVYAGDNLGERGYGVLLVAAFLLLENHATKLKLAPPAVAVVEVDEALAAKRSAAARKGAATKARNKAAAAKAARKPGTPVEKIAALKTPAPVSPAVGYAG